MDGRQASIPHDFVSGLLGDGLGESMKFLFKMTPAGFSITGLDSRFVLANERFTSAGYGACNSMEAAWLS